MDRQIAAFVVLAILGLILYLLFTSSEDVFLRYFVTEVTFLIVLVGAIIFGYQRVRQYGMNSGIGRSMAFITLGVTFWTAGDIIWTLYNFSGVEIPYPSWSDAGYLLMVPFAFWGLYSLYKTLRIAPNRNYNILMIAIPVIIFAFTYWVFIHEGLGEEISLLEKTLNVVYPVTDALLLSIGMVIAIISRKAQLYRPTLAVSLGFAILALADFIFAWATSSEIYYSGTLTDLLYVLAFFVLGVGLRSMKISIK